MFEDVFARLLARIEQLEARVVRLELLPHQTTTPTCHHCGDARVGGVGSCGRLSCPNIAVAEGAAHV